MNFKSARPNPMVVYMEKATNKTIVKKEELVKSMLVVGTTGSGKSTLINAFAGQALEAVESEMFQDEFVFKGEGP